MSFNAGDTNLYRYVGNNPMTVTDPTGMCKSTFNGMVAAATSFMFNPLGAFQANTSVSSYTWSGSTKFGSYATSTVSMNVGGFMPMTFNSSQQYNSDYALTSSSYGMGFGGIAGLQKPTNTALPASAVTSNTQSDSSWLGKVWNGVKNFGSQYWDSVSTGRQRDKINAWGNSAASFAAKEVTGFFNASNEAISATGRELDNFSKGGLGYLLQRSEDVEKSVKNAYNQTINNPKGTFIDAPANYLKSIPSRASYDWQQMTSANGGEYTGRILFNVTSASAPLFKGATATKSINYLDDVDRLAKTTLNINARGGTYGLLDAEGKVMRVGRTNDLLRRQAEHARDQLLKDYYFEPFHHTDIYAQQRGLEQLLYDTYTPPLNKIKPINPNNPNFKDYMDAAQEYLK